MVDAQGVGDPVSALTLLLSPDGRLAASCASCYELRLHRARGYGALKAILEILAQEEPLTLTEVAQRLRRTPGSTKDYLSWLEDVDLIVSQRKRYSFSDPLLRVWVRLYCRPSCPSDEEVAREVQSYALARLPRPEPAMVVAGGGESELVNEARTPAAAFHDYKSALQERVQSAGDPPPEYAVIGETGPDHHKTFQVQVRVGGKPMAEAVGRSKKEAEQEAARLALERLDSRSRDLRSHRSSLDLDSDQSISMIPHGLRSSSASSLSPPPATTIAGSGCGRRASAYDCTSRATSSSDGHDGLQ